MQVSDGWKEIHAIDNRREKLHGGWGEKRRKQPQEKNNCLLNQTTAFRLAIQMAIYIKKNKQTNRPQRSRQNTPKKLNRTRGSDLSD